MLLELQELKELILLIKKRFGIDLSDYAISSLQRRFQHIAVLNGLHSKHELFDFVNNQASKSSFVEKITVSTTEMFRDPGFWSIIKNDILKTLDEKKTVTIWHLACSSGEEVVSMNILLQETQVYKKSQVLASDLNPELLQKAEKASFPMRKMPLYKSNFSKASGRGNFDAYFDYDENKQFSFKSDFLKQTRFNVFDMVLDQPQQKFDLILCRNVMIYFNAKLQAAVLAKLCNALNPGGFLALGHNESILTSNGLSRILPYQPSENIYRVY